MPVLFEEKSIRSKLLPFTYTRHIADSRIGIVTIREKWDHFLSTKCNLTASEEYLESKYSNELDDLFINAAVLPDNMLCSRLEDLQHGEQLIYGNHVIAMRTSERMTFSGASEKSYKTVTLDKSPSMIKEKWEIFQMNEAEIESDFKWMTNGRNSAPIPSSVSIYGKPENIFIEDSATFRPLSVNVEGSKLYIGKNAEVMEGSMLQGTLAVCSNAVVKMGCKIYGATTIGPHSKVGGEISNSVIFGFSNKAHDGYLGNSVIGEWCNLGADTNVSNLKNNYGSIKVWDYLTGNYKSSGQQFCGLSMGDHSKCSINTMFNTGTTVGVSANIFGAGFPPKFIPSFSWGGADGFKEYNFREVIKVASVVMKRRNIILSEEGQNILEYLFESTKKFRT